MTPRQKRKHIAKIEQARVVMLDDGKPRIHKTLQVRRSKSAKAEAKRFLRLTSTGKVCQLLYEAKPAILMLGNAGAHMQFYERKIDGNRNMIG
jgi:hypothetical protein|tara:strand:+ start:332 stop:610 length:279 start_codon:yes stop_codon:yes gene_type:complete